MPIDRRAGLRDVRDFDALLHYLHDEMGWPIGSADFEELTFDYTPDELGIDPKSAAKIQEIKRLRPLTPNQPWGIFFVTFEPKRLPVVALRRILSSVVLKKRAFANSAERAAWAADDLLFVSNFGEGDARQITFAHFSQDLGRDALPTLKVLGWDSLDTPLHLDHVADVLTARLAWPANDRDIASWRDAWRSAFTLRNREVITTSKVLAVRLAELARGIRDRIRTVLAIETANGPVTKLMKAFQEALVHDLDAESFADMYAQTIAYGLLTARVTNPTSTGGFAAQLPVTNPFLKDLMEAFLQTGGHSGKAGRGPGIDFDELGVSEVVELLDDANMDAVVRDFGDRNPQEDPVIHFYVLFLKEYDAKKRMQRGVFYTPRPVVSYIVRSVDQLLRTAFGLEDGLADVTTWGEMAARDEHVAIPEGVSPDQVFVQILDPATGTGTFLVEVIDLIHRTLVAKWASQGRSATEIGTLWNAYVPRHLLPRLHGFELLMAPYAIAHLKIGLKLFETGYRFGSDERVRVFLTNSLEPAEDFSDRLTFAIPALAHEAQAVNEVKRKQRFTIVMGNPPYSGISANMNPWIDALLKGGNGRDWKTASYYEVEGKPLGEKKLWLQDDYVKFVRLSQWLIETAGLGVLGYITNSSYLDGPTHRGMRYQLLRAFGRIEVSNLHGSLQRDQDAPESATDENVFDIQQGVAIGLFARTLSSSATVVRHRDVWGARVAKYRGLESGDLGTAADLTPSAPWFLFVPTAGEEMAEYSEALPLNQVFGVRSTSVQTSRDAFVVDFHRDSLHDRIGLLGDDRRTDRSLRDDYGLHDGRNWTLRRAREDVRTNTDWHKSIVPYTYRAFDTRFICYRDSLVNWPRHEVMDHIASGDNVALLVPRQLAGQDFRHVYCTRLLADMCVVSTATKEAVQAFPLWLIRGDRQLSIGGPERSSNFTSEFVRRVTSYLGVPWAFNEEDADGTTMPVVGPTMCFNYIYALLHSPGYRRRYAAYLRLDFPRIPLTSNHDLLRSLATLGGDLVALHLLEAARVSHLSAVYVGPTGPVVSNVMWLDGTVWLDAPSAHPDRRSTTVGSFRGVPESVWGFRVGGYKVCEKWLKDRKGRTLTTDDIAHYQRIVVALAETIRLMGEIDEVIENHGGWPGAFARVTDDEPISRPH